MSWVRQYTDMIWCCIFKKACLLFAKITNGVISIPKAKKLYGTYQPDEWEAEKDYELGDIVSPTGSFYSGYIYKGERYYEMNMKEFMNSYGTYIQNILDYLKNEHLRIKKKSSSSSFASKQLLGDVDMFEIYEVKYVRNY